MRPSVRRRRSHVRRRRRPSSSVSPRPAAGRRAPTAVGPNAAPWSCRPRRRPRPPRAERRPSGRRRRPGGRGRSDAGQGGRKVAGSAGRSARRAIRPMRSPSTARTPGEVRDRTCSGTSRRVSSGEHRATARAVTSSASSIRAAGVRDERRLGEEDLGLAADVGGVPRRSLGAEHRDDQVGCGVAVDPAWQRPPEVDGVRRVAVAELAELAVPSVDELATVPGDDLVGSCLRPRQPVPCSHAAEDPALGRDAPGASRPRSGRRCGGSGRPWH